MVIKSYRELCNILEIKQKTGNSKIAQLKEIHRFISTTKQGNRYIIEEIYEFPLPKANGNDYNGLLQTLLLDSFIELNKRHVIASPAYLLRRLKMVNCRYGENKKEQYEYSKQIEVDTEVVNDFFLSTDSTLNSSIRTALNQLRDRALILHTFDLIVVTKNNSHRKATRGEKELILESEKETLERLGYDKISKVMFSKNWKRFKRIIKRKLQSSSNIEYYYRGYHITILLEEIEKAQKELTIKRLSTELIKQNQEELNKLVCKKLKETSESRQAKARGDKGSKRMQRARTLWVYLEEIEKLIEDNVKLIPSDEPTDALSEETIEALETFDLW